MIGNKGICLFTLILLLPLASCNEEAPSPAPEETMKKKMEVTQEDHDRNPRLIEPPQRPLTVEGPAQNELVSNPELKPWIDMAVQDLAAKLGAKAEDIDVLEARYVTWPDSSLGCPKPGMQYMQVLTDGLLIVLGNGGASYHFHGRREGPPFYCRQPQKPVTGQYGEATS